MTLKPCFLCGKETNENEWLLVSSNQGQEYYCSYFCLNKEHSPIPTVDFGYIPEVKSPCNGICEIGKNYVCKGCYRTQGEINEWREMTFDEKVHVIFHIAYRKKSLF